MKGITYCGACADYDLKKHRCKRGAKMESNPKDKFFDDCPLPTVVPVVRCRDCRYLIFSDCYGECGKGCMGIVRPDDFCSRGEKKDDDEF